ncbi:MAG: hypothetical protein ACRD8A_12690 [Candidatus Acidiferrales bacterium]
MEKVRPELPLLWSHDDTLLGLIEDKTDGLDKVSMHAYRVPLNISAGGGPSQINPDGGNLPRGSNFKTDQLFVNQVFFAFPMEWTAEMQVATDGKEKSIENYVQQAHELGVKTFRTGLEALLHGDGSGTLDSVTSVVNSPVLGVNNANQFIDQQYVQDFPNLTSGSRGTLLIMMADAIANTLTIDPSTPVPAGIAIGDLLIVDGGAGVANSSLNGLQALQLNSNVGAYLGVQRAAWPGRLSCPLIAGNSQAITPQKCRLMLNQVRLALGIDTPESAQWIWYMLVDQEAQIENIGLIVSQVIQNQVKGNSSVDMLMKTTPKTFGGRPIKCSQHGVPGRIDGLALKHWGRCQIQPIDYYDVNGQTVFPVYGDNNVPSTGFIVWWWTGFNVFNDNPRAGVYSTANAIPTGYFGH